MAKCGKCGHRIWFFQSEFVFVQMSIKGVRRVVCHLDCIIGKGIDLKDGLGSGVDVMADPNKSIYDIDQDLKETWK